MDKIDITLDEAVELCVQKFLNIDKNEGVVNKSIIELIKDNIEDYTSYSHYYPYFVHWIIESECNLRCKHCLYLNSPEKYKKEQNLSTQQAIDLIDEFFEMDILSIGLSGGEIFLREDIFEILAKLKTRTIALTLMTNATLITQEIANKLKSILDKRIDKFQISLDGATQEIHDKTRGKGAFEGTINGIKYLINAGFSVVINFVPTTINIHEIFEIYCLAQKLGVSFLNISRFTPYSATQNYLVPDIDELFKAIGKVIYADSKRKKSMLNTSTFLLYDFIVHKVASKIIYKYNKKEGNKTSKISKYSCHNNDRVSIDRNGDVYLCSKSKTLGFDCLGNVREKTLKEIWSNRHEHILFQKRNANEIACKHCEYYKDKCYGGCPITAYMKYKNINAPDSSCAIGENLMLEMCK